MKRVAMYGLAALAATAWALPASAQRGAPPKNVLLAEEIADFDRETDRFNVGGDKGRYESITISAERSAFRLYEVVVRFANGQSQTYKIDKSLKEGGRGATIEFNGRPRRIESVEATYETFENARQRGIAQLIGRRFIPRRLERRDLEVLAEGSFTLDTKSIGLDIGRREGRLSGIRVAVSNRDVFVRAIRVVFGNGADQVFPVNNWIDSGSASEVLKFDRPRLVKRVALAITERRGRRRAKVEVLGLKARGRPGRRAYAAPASLGIAPRTDRRGTPVGFDRVGDVRLSDRTAPNTIRVGRRAGLIKGLAFRPVGNSARIAGIVITYGNGQQDKIDYQDRMREGQISRTIDLGRGRFVEDVSIIGRSRRRGPTASIELYADPAERGRGRERGRDRRDRRGDAGRRGRGDWVMLTSRRPPLFKSETAVIPVGRRAGRIRAIRLAVKRHDVRIYDMDVRLANGRTQSVSLRGKIPDGSTTSEVSLNYPYVEEIRIKFQTSLNLKGEGLVEFWALR